MSTYKVRAERSGKYWAVHVPGVDRWTQARHLRELNDMARDLIHIMTDEDPGSIDLDVEIILPEAARSHLEREKELRQAATETAANAAKESRLAARALHDQGIPLRDIGRILGISHQRAHQLVADS